MKLSELVKKLQSRCECADEEVLHYQIAVGSKSCVITLEGPDEITVPDVVKVSDMPENMPKRS